MKTYPKTIKIFLIDGEPDGLRTVELSNWVGQAVVIPRNKLKEAKNRPECNKPAVYFLRQRNGGSTITNGICRRSGKIFGIDYLPMIIIKISGKLRLPSPVKTII